MRRSMTCAKSSSLLEKTLYKSSERHFGARGDVVHRGAREAALQKVASAASSNQASRNSRSAERRGVERDFMF